MQALQRQVDKGSAGAVNNYFSRNRKTVSRKANLPQIVSLFCGAGGLDLGFHQEGYKIAVAIDLSPAAIDTHKKNFSSTSSHAADLLVLGPDGVLDLVKKKIALGSKIGVIGGPPCQGFSRANARSVATDPRNRLASLYLDIIQHLQKNYDLEFVVFENVLGLKDKKHSQTYQSIVGRLRDLNFEVTEKVLCATDFGVPQTRKRVILSAIHKRSAGIKVVPQKRKGHATVEQAIGHLVEPAFYSPSLCRTDIPHHPNHWTMRPKSWRFFAKPEQIPKGRSFKKLRWDAASPTIAFGHREIHVHPSGKRRLSIYEAMLLQGFPHEYVLQGNLSQQVEQVSNAVPPPLARSVAAAVKKALGIIA